MKLTLLKFLVREWFKTEFQIKFNGLGYPTFINIKKPSTALAIIQLPLTIIRSIIELPTKLIQLRVNMDSSKANEIQSQINLRKIQEQYEALDKKAAGIATGGNVAGVIPPNQNTRSIDSSLETDSKKMSDLEESVENLRGELNATRKRVTDIRMDVRKLKENNDSNNGE